MHCSCRTDVSSLSHLSKQALVRRLEVLTWRSRDPTRCEFLFPQVIPATIFTSRARLAVQLPAFVQHTTLYFLGVLRPGSLHVPVFLVSDTSSPSVCHESCADAGAISARIHLRKSIHQTKRSRDVHTTSQVAACRPDNYAVESERIESRAAAGII